MTIRTKVAAAILAVAASTMLISCSAGKPSQEEVRAGYEQLLDSTELGQSVPAEMKGPLLDCIVPKAYDQLSDKALRAIADGDADAGISAEDNSKLSQIGQECGQEVAGQMG